jgi:hypothetical protein
VPIICVERVLVGVADLAASSENWRRAGFSICTDQFDADGLRFARLAAGAVEIDLCNITSADSQSILAPHLREAAANQTAGAIIGWVWGDKDKNSPVFSGQGTPATLPGLSGALHHRLDPRRGTARGRHRGRSNHRRHRVATPIARQPLR